MLIGVAAMPAAAVVVVVVVVAAASGGGGGTRSSRGTINLTSFSGAAFAFSLGLGLAGAVSRPPLSSMILIRSPSSFLFLSSLLIAGLSPLPFAGCSSSSFSDADGDEDSGGGGASFHL